MPKTVRYDLIKYLFDDVFKLFRAFFHMSEFPESNFYYEIVFQLLPRK